jgi:hypothetical protein
LQQVGSAYVGGRQQLLQCCNKGAVRCHLKGAASDDDGQDICEVFELKHVTLLRHLAYLRPQLLNDAQQQRGVLEHRICQDLVAEQVPSEVYCCYCPDPQAARVDG